MNWAIEMPFIEVRSCEIIQIGEKLANLDNFTKKAWQRPQNGCIIAKLSFGAAPIEAEFFKTLKNSCWQGLQKMVLYKSCRETVISSLKIKQLKANKTRW